MDKESLLKEIEELLTNSEHEISIDSYILKYLSIDELHSIKSQLQKKQESIIEDNHKWLEQFKKYL